MASQVAMSKAAIPLCLQCKQPQAMPRRRPLMQILIQEDKEFQYKRRGGVLTQGSDIEESACDWCKKPRYMWTSRLRNRGFGKSYCSAKCYAAGEYKTNLYFALCSILALGFGFAFVSLQLMSSPSEFYIGVTLFLLIIFFTYSSICAYFPLIGRSERRKRDSSLE